jgi:hypothetical protein
VDGFIRLRLAVQRRTWVELRGVFKTERMLPLEKEKAPARARHPLALYHMYTIIISSRASLHNTIFGKYLASWDYSQLKGIDRQIPQQVNVRREVSK